jgi:hypothetical protein
VVLCCNVKQRSFHDKSLYSLDRKDPFLKVSINQIIQVNENRFANNYDKKWHGLLLKKMLNLNLSNIA